MKCSFSGLKIRGKIIPEHRLHPEIHGWMIVYIKKDGKDPEPRLIKRVKCKTCGNYVDWNEIDVGTGKIPKKVEFCSIHKIKMEKREFPVPDFDSNGEEILDKNGKRILHEETIDVCPICEDYVD